MAKKPSSDATTAPAAKRTPEEKAQRKAEKAERKAAKAAPKGKASKKDSDKQATKTAHKQLRKDLDAQLNELSSRIRKETKAQVKDIMRQATSRFQTEAQQLVAAHPATTGKSSKQPAATDDAPNTVTNVATEAAPAPPAKRPSRPAAAKKPAASASAPKPAAPSRSRSRRPAANGAPELSTPQGTTNDSVAVDTV